VNIAKNSLLIYKEYKILFIVKNKTILIKLSIVLIEEIN
jgi:hypothetical protein